MTTVTQKPEVLIPGPIPAYPMQQLQASYVVHDRTHISDPEGFKNIASKVTGVIGGGDSKVPKELMQQLPKLGMVAVIGVGYDGVDAAYASANGILVSYTPNVLNDDVADLALALMLCSARRLPQNDAYVRAGRWAKEGAFPLQTKVSGARVGIVGMGRIGKTIAKRCAGFDMSTAYTGRNKQTDLSFPYYPSAKELAANVDFLVVITPGGAATKHLINSEVLTALGKGRGEGFLVNVARGTVVDQAALIKALQDKTIAGAGLDVFDGEPTVPEAFYTLDNVTLLPHVGSATNATRKAMADLALGNLENYYAGKPLLSAVPECQ